ncbi:MAG: hypothetical protein GX764_00735, partial [Firmicutes bacterium]|nr:hypothetical protein [Bacillota bacterium]
MGYILVVIAITGITYLIIGVARRGKSERHYLPPLFIAACAVTITVAVILFPEDAFEASLHGLD